MRSTVKILFFVYVLFNFCSAVQAPMFPLFIHELVGDLRHVGALYGLFSISAALSIAVALYFGHQVKLDFWILGYVLYALYSLVLYFQPDVVYIYMLQIVGGVAFGVAGACFRFVFSYAQKNSELYAEDINVMKLIAGILGALASLGGGVIAHYSSLKDIFLGAVPDNT